MRRSGGGELLRTEQPPEGSLVPTMAVVDHDVALPTGDEATEDVLPLQHGAAGTEDDLPLDFEFVSLRLVGSQELRGGGEIGARQAGMGPCWCANIDPGWSFGHGLCMEETPRGGEQLKTGGNGGVGRGCGWRVETFLRLARGEVGSTCRRWEGRCWKACG